MLREKVAGRSSEKIDAIHFANPQPAGHKANNTSGSDTKVGTRLSSVARGREDLNLHTLTGAYTSSMRVCQFRHDRELCNSLLQLARTPTSSSTFVQNSSFTEHALLISQDIVILSR